MLSIRIWISHIITLPLTILVWVHHAYMSLLSVFGRDRTRERLWQDLRNAETFEQWEAAGLALDHHYNIDSWRRDDQSKVYAWQLISERLNSFTAALTEGDIQALVRLLQSGLTRNLGNVTEPALYNVSFAGTKYLIENYILQVCEVVGDLVTLPAAAASSPGSTAPGGTAGGQLLHSRALARAVVEGRASHKTVLRGAGQKLDMFRNLRQSCGQSTLVLQGGSLFGLCHLGVARALFLRGLLPRVITGMGTGALVAALIGIHTDEELPGVLSGDMINLTAFTARAQQDGTASLDYWTRLATLSRRAKRFWNEGYFLDVTVLEQCIRDNGGLLTFEEAFNRTGRVLNITVVGGGEGEVPPVLNYVTAPEVLIWSAAVASNASTNEPARILCKNLAGETVPWPLSADTQFKHWLDSPHTKPPLRRVAQLFNVNHFIVSQARPYLVPFQQPSMHGPQMRGYTMRSAVGLRNLGFRMAGRLLRLRLGNLLELGVLPRSLRRMLLDETISGADSIVLVPDVPATDYWRLLDSPTPEGLLHWVQMGEKSVWPAVAALKVRCSVELALVHAFESVQEGAAARRKGSGFGLARLGGAGGKKAGESSAVVATRRPGVDKEGVGMGSKKAAAGGSKTG